MKLLLSTTFLLLTALSTQALERLCDPAFEDCRAPLISLIRTETKAIDAAWWFMTDSRYAVELIKRHKAGVTVRVIADLRANSTYPGNARMLQMLKDARVPVRHKTSPGILHYKMMLFDGQGTVEFGSANFSPHAFRPEIPYANYTDETVYFTEKPDVVNSFRRRFDDLWIDTRGYADYANVTARARRYPLLPISPEMNFVPAENFALRNVKAINDERGGIDVIQYRLTDARHVDALIAARSRGQRVRLITEPSSYRSKYPAHALSVDRLFAAGVEIKHRKHLGLNHQKLTILHGSRMAVFGSSNWSAGSADSQEEHNYFAKDLAVYEWFKDQFERKWNSTEENTPFVPLGPSRPVLASPIDLSAAVVLTPTLEWSKAAWAVSYDLYLGTGSSPPLYRSGLTSESFALPELEPATRYFWKIASKTAAGKASTSAVRSFVTEGADEQ